MVQKWRLEFKALALECPNLKVWTPALTQLKLSRADFGMVQKW
jgi:hypothetical protein